MMMGSQAGLGNIEAAGAGNLAAAAVSAEYIGRMDLSMKSKWLLFSLYNSRNLDGFTERGIASVMKEGISSIRSAVKELLDAGCLARERIRDEAGRFCGIRYSLLPVFVVPGTDCEADGVPASGSSEYALSDAPYGMTEEDDASAEPAFLDMSAATVHKADAGGQQEPKPAKSGKAAKIPDAASSALLRISAEYGARVAETVGACLDDIYRPRVFISIGKERMRASTARKKLDGMTEETVFTAAEAVVNYGKTIRNMNSYLRTVLWNAIDSEAGNAPVSGTNAGESAHNGVESGHSFGSGRSNRTASGYSGNYASGSRGKRNAFNNFEQRDIDYDDLERRLLMI